MPYFKAGLENHEVCLWVTGRAFNAEEARSALRTAVPDLDARERDKQIDIANGEEWYGAREKLRPHELVSGLVQREQDALARGYAGLRTNGNCSWVSPGQWADFLDYEGLVQKVVRGRQMICMCSYCGDQLGAGSHLEVMDRHDLSMASTKLSLPRLHAPDDPAGDELEFDVRASLERQKQTFELAMLASDMGTWR